MTPIPPDEPPDAPIQRRLGALSPEFASLSSELVSPSPDLASLSPETGTLSPEFGALNSRRGQMKIRFMPPGRRPRGYDAGSGRWVTGSGNSVPGSP